MEIKTYVGAIRKAAAYVRARAPSLKPSVGVILGSGLAKAVPPLSGAVTIPYDRIPGFPRTTVAGHEGKLVLGRYRGLPAAVLQGRFHYYEGHSMEAIALPIRVLEGPVPPYRFPMHLCWHERTQDDPAVAAFRDVVVEALAARQPSRSARPPGRRTRAART